MLAVAPEACALDAAPLLIGSGRLWVSDGEAGALQDAGNFEIVDVVGDGEALRVFQPGENGQGIVAVRESVSLVGTGDTYSLENLQRLLNEPPTATVLGNLFPLRTVWDLPVRRIRFLKPLRIDPCAPVPSCGGLLEIVLWRAYFDVPFEYEMKRAEATNHIFRIIGLPDSENHPSQPFGYMLEHCPTGVSS